MTRDFRKPHGAAGAAGRGGAGTGGSAGNENTQGGRGGQAPAAGAGDEGGDAGTDGGGQAGASTCTSEGAIECTGHAQRGRRQCKNGLLAAYDSCASDERCDTRASSAGQCKPVLAECSGKEPGQGTCDGLVRSDCGADLVTLENTETCDGFCVEHDGVAECSACKSGRFSADGTVDGCTPYSDCAKGKYVSTPPTATSDRGCSTCKSGTFSATTNATSCSDWTACTWAQGGLVTPGTTTSDAVCGDASSPYRQFGTSENENFYGIARDSIGNLYLGGMTRGDLFRTNAGGPQDAIWMKLDTNGEVVSSTQFGTGENDVVQAIGVDSDGNVVVAGSTRGALPGAADPGDLFIRKYTAAGAIAWTRQMGATDTYSQERIASMTVDSLGDIFVGGSTNREFAPSHGQADGWVQKYDSEGNLLFTDQMGTSDTDSAKALALDKDGNLFVAGDTYGSFGATSQGEFDAWIRKYAPGGAVVWTKQFGSTLDEAVLALGTDSSGNAYVGGRTSGLLATESAGGSDAFVRKYDPNGNAVWTRQFGSSGYDEIDGLTVASDGSIYATGSTEGVLDAPAAGGVDGFVVRYTSDGKQSWIRQFGSAADDWESAIVTDENGYAYIAGFSAGKLETLNHGSDDVYVFQLVP